MERHPGAESQTGIGPTPILVKNSCSSMSAFKSPILISQGVRPSGVFCRAFADSNFSEFDFSGTCDRGHTGYEDSCCAIPLATGFNFVEIDVLNMISVGRQLERGCPKVAAYRFFSSLAVIRKRPDIGGVGSASAIDFLQPIARRLDVEI
jgi:hypothetical protein